MYLLHYYSYTQENQQIKWQNKVIKKVICQLTVEYKRNYKDQLHCYTNLTL